MNLTDGALLRRFIAEHDETAFRELVSRHLPLVHASARRQLGGDLHLADDVAQKVFALLAARAARLCDHPSVAGWLFTVTRNLARSTRRDAVKRSQREQEAALMRETDQITESGWSEIQVVLDDALDKLAESDREGVLLRYFAGCSYGEIAAKYGINENAARMRVDRALDKLRRVLHRRGIGSTVAALGLTLTSHAAPAVAVETMTRISAHAIAAQAALATNAVGVSAVLQFMSKMKLAVALSTIAVGIAVYEGSVARTERNRAREAMREADALQAEVAKQARALDEMARRVQAADDDNARLLAGIAQVQTVGVAAAANATTPSKYTRKQVVERYERAQKLARAGKSEEALREYLWCYDVGMTDMQSFGRRFFSLPQDLADLGKTYAPALVALRERLDAAAQRLKADSDDYSAGTEFSVLCKALKDDARMLDQYFALPATDSRRGSLLLGGVFEMLVASGRYGDAVAGKPFAAMKNNMDMMLAIEIPNSLPNAEKAQRDHRDFIVKNALLDFETLAGSGQIENARTFAEKLLAYDNSAATRTALGERAKKVGREELVSGLTATR